MDKVCRDCGQAKPVTEFFADKKRKDGYGIRCKPCYMAQQAIYRMREPWHKTDPGTKRCVLCKEIKPESDFTRNKGFHDGLDRTCRACAAERNAAYTRANREALNASALRRYHANTDRYADYSLKRHYGMSRGDYDRMLAEQGGRCAICGSTSPNGVRISRFHVDHCHETGRVRGLLCENCNKGIGLFHDNPDLIMLAIKYLERYPK